MIVMMIAITPSLKASSLPLPMLFSGPQDLRTSNRDSDLFEMVLVVRRHLVQFILQRPHAGHAVDEFEMTVLLVVLPRVIDIAGAHRLVDAARHLERNSGVIETFGEGILVEHP